MMHQVSSIATISKTIHSPINRFSQPSLSTEPSSVTTILRFVFLRRLRLIECKNGVIVTATAWAINIQPVTVRELNDMCEGEDDLLGVSFVVRDA